MLLSVHVVYIYLYNICLIIIIICQQSLPDVRDRLVSLDIIDIR